MSQPNEEKVFRVRLTASQIRFLIHVLRAYGFLRADEEIRRQTELDFLRTEYVKGGGYLIVKLFKEAVEENTLFNHFHPMSIGNRAQDLATLLERILQGGRPHRKWMHKRLFPGFPTDFTSPYLARGTKNMVPPPKHNSEQ